MGQLIRTRNLKKSGFTLIANVWSKVSMAEGSLIMGDTHSTEAPSIQEVETKVGDIERRLYQSIRSTLPVYQVDSTSLSGRLYQSTRSTPDEVEHTKTILVEEAYVVREHGESVPEPLGHSEDIAVEDVPAQGEPVDATYEDRFVEGIVKDEFGDDANTYQHTEIPAMHKEPAMDDAVRKKAVHEKLPRLTRRSHNKPKKMKICVHLEPILARLDAQGELICSLQTDLASVLHNHHSQNLVLREVISELEGTKIELSSLSAMMTDLTQLVRTQGHLYREQKMSLGHQGLQNRQKLLLVHQGHRFRQKKWLSH
ncbi:hypothetical protein Taro_034628 [Colocasia esculenta]|uniref:Uncharacterized protein n=1 Tax=Colocasia esculenta TaxID=4460 RepID=A0A843WG24_COLES|nr:hypothetical protein [Colocasia esculenta]